MTDQMYKPMPRSPMTTLHQGIDSTQTTITVADATKLPDAPNKATIGGGDDSETVKYTGKSGNDLTGCERGFDPEGSAKAWDSDAPVARVWTSQDLDVVQDNLTALDGHDNTLHSENYITDTQEHGNEKHNPDFIPATEKGANDGVATLDSGGDVPATQLGNVDDSGMETHGNEYHNPNMATAIDLNSHENEVVDSDNVHGLREGSIAIGSGSSAGGVNSVALGYDSSADGDWSVALGLAAIAVNDRDITLGIDDRTVRVPGHFEVSGSKDFGITNPANPDEDLRHGCVESPTPQNIYRFSVELDQAEVEQGIELPDWFEPLNADPQVFVSPNRHFGRGYGYVENNTLKIAGDKAGEYNVQVIASRNEAGQAGRRIVKPKGLRWNGETSAIVDTVNLDDGTELRKVYRAKQGCTKKCDEDFESARVYKDKELTRLTKEECKDCRSDKDIVKLAGK